MDVDGTDKVLSSFLPHRQEEMVRLKVNSKTHRENWRID